jgi:peptidyl-prolyl cis-trans isomerase A (cyclophilin A)
MTRTVKPTSPVTPFAYAAACAVALTACNAAPEPKPDPAATQKPASSTPAQVSTATAKPQIRPMPPPDKGPHVVHAQPVAEVKASEDDPLKGKWTLEDATKGLPKGDLLVASIETDLGTLECKLFDDKAPITVANFVGLARGLRPWKTPDQKWEKKAAYDGTIFHRIVKGFMIQGGDAMKNGSGEAGYVIPDEVWEGATHDRAGLLCMANRGANTNSAQFFITDEAAAHLDFDNSHGRPRGGYTIFGECGPIDLVHKIASVKMKSREQPETPPVIKKVTITRKVAPPAAASASASAAASVAPSASASVKPAVSGSAAPKGSPTTPAPGALPPTNPPTAPAPTK